MEELIILNGVESQLVGLGCGCALCSSKSKKFMNSLARVR